MFNESLRELNYMASLAGITGQIAPKQDHVYIRIDGFADQIENYVAEFFKHLQKFETSEQYFENIKDQQFQIFLNSLYQEPYSRLTKFLNCALVGGDPNIYN